MYEVDDKAAQYTAVGRRLMDLAWDTKATPDDATANMLSALGTKCVSVGIPFGAKYKDFTEGELKIINAMIKKEVDLLI